MLTVFVPKLTNRVGYTLKVLFTRLMRVDYCITTDAAHFATLTTPTLCYAPERVGQGVYLKSCNLLFSTTIEEQRLQCRKEADGVIMFPVYGGGTDLPFDPLAAIFFMISRYEEYLPFKLDAHGRFGVQQSVAYREDFVMQPVVEQWGERIAELLRRHFPELKIVHRQFMYLQTIDIDAAWCYKHKGFGRNMAGLVRDAVKPNSWPRVVQRLRVMLRREPDPFDTYDFIISHSPRKVGGHLLFFALVADYDHYDKPISHLEPHLRHLMMHLGDYAKIGLHPGYYTMEQPSQFDVEKQRLEAMLHRNVLRSRFHYLRMRLPYAYRILLHAGVQTDYSMGFADGSGFRAGISIAYPFFDLERDIETTLDIQPFCTMDTSQRMYQGLTADEAVQQSRSLIDELKTTGGTFCSVCHNQNLSAFEGWEPWREAYADVAKYAIAAMQ
ncbi:MAG: polysaccharide deacetylase family protein [Bacteroidales bacterium]|nr:polysaccharide deacetylase family protein [Bacteroidales bacterium]